MKIPAGFLTTALLGAALACSGQLDAPPPKALPDAGPSAADAGPTGYDELDIERAQARFATTTDLMRYVFAPGCAAENNECHSNEDFPDLHTEGNLWNLVDLPCNLGVGERDTVEDFCESSGDELRITAGANTGFIARIGAIDVITDDAGEFVEYRVQLETAVPQGEADASFEIVRNGIAAIALGSGNSLAALPGGREISITNVDELLDPAQVRQGDENRNGIYGAGTGSIVSPGNARDSYLIRRLMSQETSRVRMPLNENADNPNELNRHLSVDEMYAIMSWINCMQPEDGVYSAIRYGCANNANNDGRW